MPTLRSCQWCRWTGRPFAKSISRGSRLAMRRSKQSVPDYQEWDERHLSTCRLVARWNDKMLGWAALSRVSSRCVYAGVAEVSIYIAEEVRGRGIGRKLLHTLVEASEQNGIWTLQAGIFAENAVSIRLHQQAGFRIVGTRERIGCLDGRWR